MDGRRQVVCLSTDVHLVPKGQKVQIESLTVYQEQQIRTFYQLVKSSDLLFFESRLCTD